LNAAWKKTRRDAEPEGEAKMPPARLVAFSKRGPGPYAVVDPDSSVGTTLPEGVP
jgi:hypothetical protein